MVFPDARCQQDDDDLDLSPDGEERMTMGDDDEEDPYEYDDELPRMPDSAEPNFLDDDLILEGKHFDRLWRGRRRTSQFNVLFTCSIHWLPGH